MLYKDATLGRTILWLSFCTAVCSKLPYQQNPLINKHVLVKGDVFKMIFPVLITSSFLPYCTLWNCQSCREDSEWNRRGSMDTHAHSSSRPRLHIWHTAGGWKQRGSKAITNLRLIVSGSLIDFLVDFLANLWPPSMQWIAFLISRTQASLSSR